MRNLLKYIGIALLAVGLFGINAEARNLNDPKILVGHWLLNSNADDSLKKQDGTWVGTETYDTNQYGKSCASLDGSSFINLETQLPTDGSAWSVSLFLKIDSIPGADVNVFGQYALTFAGRTAIICTSNSAIAFFNDDSGTAFIYTANTNEWVHIVVTNDGSGNISGYANGNFKVSDTGCSNVLSTNTLIGAGYDTNGTTPTRYFTGKVSNVRIYNVALTGDEVKQIFKQDRRVIK